MNAYRNKKFTRNVIVDYIYCFFNSFTITDGIWVLYLGFKGMSLTQIGLLESIFHIVSLLFEIPTGVMADLIGRKSTILLGRFLSIISSCLMIFSHSFWGFAFSFAFLAASYNLNSGSEEALVFDSLKQENKTEEYEKINGRLNVVIELSHAIAVFLGGILSEISFTNSYITTIIISFLALISASFFKEPLSIKDDSQTLKITIKKSNDSSINETNTKSSETKSTLKYHIQASKNIIKNNRNVRNTLFFFPVIFTFAQIVYYYGQQHFDDLLFNKIEISIIFLFCGLTASLGAVSSTLISKLFGKNMRYFIGIFVGMGVSVCGSYNRIIAVTAFLAVSFLASSLYPVASYVLNIEIESKQRATILSINGLMYSLYMILLFSLVGFLGDNFGLKIVFQMLGVINILFSVTFLWLTNKKI